MKPDQLLPLLGPPDDALPRPGVRRRSVVARRYQRRDYYGRRALAVADVVALLAALTVTGLLSSRHHPLGDYLLAAIPLLFAALPIFRAYRLYDRDARRVSHSALDDVPALFHGLMVLGLVEWAWYRLIAAGHLDVRQLAFPDVVLLAALSMALILVARTAARRLLAAHFGPERVLLVGDRGPTRTLVRKMRSHPEYQLDPVGVLTTRDVDVISPDLPVLGQTGDCDLEEVVAHHNVDRVVLSHTDLDQQAMVELVSVCRLIGVKVSILPELFDALGTSTEIDDVEGVTLLAVHTPVLSRTSRLLKRTLDVTLSAVGLILLSPVAAAIALAIKIDSRGPVLFRQERIGRADRRFRVLKFRTMVRDAEGQREALLESSEDPNWLLITDDPRVTRIGRILRHTSLDELPQLVNVVRGDMSLVGPRPLIESEDARVGGWARGRLDLTPGITGLWQVLGRTNIPFDEMVKLDYLYVTNWSLWGDIRLIFKTFAAVAQRRGVN